MLINKVTKYVATHVRAAAALLLVGLMLSGTGFIHDAFANAHARQVSSLAEVALNNVNRRGQRVSLKFNGTPLASALQQVARAARVGISFNPDIIPDKKITRSFNNIPVQEAMQALLQGTGLEAAIPPSRDVLVVREKIQSPDKLAKAYFETVTGQVTDAETGEPIPLVNVLLKGTTTGTTSDLEGNYNLEVPDLTGTLIFSYIGYVRREVPINGRTRIDVTLQPEITGLDEVVVVGYGTQERSDLTGSISSIQPEELEGQAFSSVEEAMQGKIPGVQIFHSSGEPGASMQIRIRGVGTFGDASPLYIVDGVPIKGEDMASINPNNIASLEILKDASAAAIYGARAANGVVLITTKDGQSGAPRISYNGYYGIQSFTDFIPMLNSVQYAELNNEGVEASGYPYESAYYPADPAVNENLQHNTNWQDAAFSPAPMMNHTLSVSGGTDNATYLISGGYFGQEGIMVFNRLERYSARINTQFDISDQLTLGESLSFSRTSGLNRGEGTDLHFSYLLGASPTMRIYNPENEGGYAGPNAAQTGINNRANIIGRRDMRRNYDYTNRLLGNVFAEYDILPELHYRLNLGINARMNTEEQFVPTYDMDNRTHPVAERNTSKSENYEYLIENILSYETEINDEHSVSLLAGFSQQNSSYSFLEGAIQEFPSNDLQVIDAGTGTFTIGGNKAEWALRSYFARASFTFFDKYLVTATFRRDGSSRFGSENRYGNFPSFALGWIISEESFMADIPYIDQLKLRASWGKLGNQDIGNYVNQTTVSTTPRYIFGDQIAPAAAVVSLGNPLLRWEATVQTDVGFDLQMFNNRLILYADYFVKDTEDILLRVPISSATGIERDNGPFRNAAGLRNSGFEFQLTYRENAGDLFYSLSGNIATVKNEVTALGGESSIIDHPQNAYGYGVYTYTTVGQPMSSFYGWVMDGIFQNQAEIDAHATQTGAEPGDVRFVDINEDGVIDDADRTIIGDAFPDFTYGFSANAAYKGFDLSLSVQGVQGRDLYNSQRAFLESMNGEHGQMATTLNRWHGEGTSNTMPRAVRDDPNDNSRASTRFVEDASYLRLQNLQIGYTVPPELISRIGVRNLRVYVNGQNLLVLTGYTNYSPDVGGGGDPLAFGVDEGSYPIPRVYQLGVEIGF